MCLPDSANGLIISPAFGWAVNFQMYARYGRGLMGCSPLCMNPANMLNILAKVLVEGKSEIVE